MTSRTLTVAFLRRTMMAAMPTRNRVDQMGGMLNAPSKAEVTELPMTWLTPHQHSRPDRAKRTAMTLLRPVLLKKFWM